MPLKAEELEAFVQEVIAFKGQTIKIDESISRSRNIGNHDRHFSTHTFFTMTTEDIYIAFSGAQLIIQGNNCRYGISLDSVVGYSKTVEHLEIIEQFEQKTERLTTISA